MNIAEEIFGSHEGIFDRSIPYLQKNQPIASTGTQNMFFVNLAKEPQNFEPLPKNLGVETESPTTLKAIFVSLYDKIVQAEKILEGIYKPLQMARILLNDEIKRQFPSITSRNVFNMKKCLAINIFKIFSTEGLGEMISSELGNLVHRLLEKLKIK
ncbi:7158_t:CDS:2 [Rhizophagus irregularis]|nr:7158_t:CDS:2 [Rhizophagus irregularis]